MKKLVTTPLGGILFIGPAIGTLLFYLFMDWRYKSTTNEVTDEQVIQYMKNSQVYPMIFSDFTYKVNNYDRAHYKQSIRMSQYIYYEKNTRKYFSYFGIDIYAVTEKTFASLKEVPFMGKVNIDEMNSGKGNSIDNPILVWDISISPSLINTKAPWQGTMFEETVSRKKHRREKQTDVYLKKYFKHFVSKEDFEKTFPKKE